MAQYDSRGFSELCHRILTEDPDALVQWPHNDQVEAGYPPHLVQTFCVENKDWQKIRLSMKGMPTHKKLKVLKDYWDERVEFSKSFDTPLLRNMAFTALTIQVGNYLGALRRGGQLDDQNRIRKYI